MKICRFNQNRLGVVEGDIVRDITDALTALPAMRWPVPPGDHLIAHWPLVLDHIERLLPRAPVLPLADVTLLNPIANPSKIIAAPLNYDAHVTEVGASPAIHAGTHSFRHDGFATPIDKLGLFLKANTSLSGAGESVNLVYPERRTDHEVELVVVIGRGGRDIAEATALDHVFGYCIGLDMTVRGPEDRSFRKSPDTYTVLGPALVTRDEIEMPDDLPMSLHVNGQPRQSARTSSLTVGIPRLIAIASSCYTLYPGDIIMTGTPDGVGEVRDGDELVARIGGLGELRVRVANAGRPAVHGVAQALASSGGVA